MGTQKNHLNETVLLGTQNTCLANKYNFTLIKFPYLDLCNCFELLDTVLFVNLYVCYMTFLWYNMTVLSFSDFCLQIFVLCETFQRKAYAVLYKTFLTLFILDTGKGVLCKQRRPR